MGTGAIEIKSGYGLTLDSEIKTLRVIKRLKENTEVTIKATFLGAIKHESGFEAMPKSAAKLSDEIIQQLECWEKTGFKEN